MQPDPQTNQTQHEPSRLSTTSSLINDLQELSPQRWERFVLVYSPLLNFWIRRSNVPESDQDDILQESLQSIVKGIGKFKKEPQRGTFRGWLKTIVHRRVADYFRAKNPERLASQATLEAMPGVEQKTPEEIQAEQQALTELKARAMELVRQSTHKQTWEMFWLSVVEEIPTAEVARQFGVKAANVRVARGRVLKRLRELMVDDI